MLHLLKTMESNLLFRRFNHTIFILVYPSMWNQELSTLNDKMLASKQTLDTSFLTIIIPIIMKRASCFILYTLKLMIDFKASLEKFIFLTLLSKTAKGLFPIDMTMLSSCGGLFATRAGAPCWLLKRMLPLPGLLHYSDREAASFIFPFYNISTDISDRVIPHNRDISWVLALSITIKDRTSD